MLRALNSLRRTSILLAVVSLFIFKCQWSSWIIGQSSARMTHEVIKIKKYCDFVCRNNLKITMVINHADLGLCAIYKLIGNDYLVNSAIFVL